MNPYKYICNQPEQKLTPAQVAIEKALLSLLDKKEMAKISVKEVCLQANVARSTFYTYYDVIDDCLFAIENRFLREMLEINATLKDSENVKNIDFSFFEETLRYIEENRQKLYLFMIKRYNVRFVNRWKDAIKYHLYHQMPAQLSEKNKELTLEIIAAGTIGVYQHWLRNPYEVDVCYVKQLLRKTLEVYTET